MERVRNILQCLRIWSWFHFYNSSLFLDLQSNNDGDSHYNSFMNSLRHNSLNMADRDRDG